MPVRFKLGDRVRVIRVGYLSPAVATVIEVDTKPIVPHYMLDFGNGDWLRVPDFDLAPAVEFGGEREKGSQARGS